LHKGTPEQVEVLLDLGTRVVMLPMFERAREVATLIELVAGRATVVPLLETCAGAARDRRADPPSAGDRDASG
jgi:hypothetical protein